jgi:hypothetical protein
VTVVLIGAETASREWVQFEIQESTKRKNGFLGIQIHHLKDSHSAHRAGDFLWPQE